MDKMEGCDSTKECSAAEILEKVRDNVQAFNSSLETMRVELMTTTMKAIVPKTKLNLEQEVLLISQIEAFKSDLEQLKIDLK